MIPSVRIRLGRGGLREAMRRQVRERVSREAALDDPLPGEAGRPQIAAAGRFATAEPPILTKS